MTGRRRLPARRSAETFEIECSGLRFTITAGRYPDGSLDEVFITNHKAGSTAGIMASDSAIVASLCLQWGIPLDLLRKSLSRDAHGHASGVLGRALDRLAGDES
jgi:ribonucleoside-diphosphate reductase alpha chain